MGGGVVEPARWPRALWCDMVIHFIRRCEVVWRDRGRHVIHAGENLMELLNFQPAEEVGTHVANAGQVFETDIEGEICADKE